MIAILGSFLQYLIIMILLAAIGVAGAVVGKKLRERKDAKEAAMTAEEHNYLRKHRDEKVWRK